MLILIGGRILLTNLNFQSRNAKITRFWNRVTFIGTNKIRVTVRLHPKDFELYGSFVRDDYIINFKNKNQPILDVLVEQKIPIIIDNNSNVVAHNRVEKFPPEITAVLDKKIQKNAVSIYSDARKFIPKPNADSAIKSIDFLGDKVAYCKSCNIEFDTLPDNAECPTCGRLVFIIERVSVDKKTIENPLVKGENGLVIIVIDFDSSMNGLTFLTEPEHAISKADVVASALKFSLPRMKRIHKAEMAYVAMIGFTENAKILKIFKASELSDRKEFWDDWLRESIDDVRRSFGMGTNITRALKLARELYDDALKGDLSSYGVYDFSPMYQNIIIGSEVYDIANVRVFIYSDGEYFVNDEFVNYFEDASLIPGKTNVSGLISVFLGDASDSGYRTMEKIAGICPHHEIKAVIHLNQVKYYQCLAELFHMTSSTSGACAQCARSGKILRIKME